MINSLYNAAANVKKQGGGLFKQSEFKAILNEATSNENWNISNSKLQVLADHTYNWEDYNVIMKHLWAKVQSKPKDWRRIFKALNCMDYLCKNGAPRVVQEIKDDLYKIRTLQDFNMNENGIDRGQGVRDKSRELCELLSDPTMLQNEREFARQTREKLQGTSQGGSNAMSMGSHSMGGGFGSSGGMGGPPTSMSSASFQGGGPNSSAAGPASGKYGGFGSEDIARLGYNTENKFNAPYDPYTKGQSAPSANTFQVANAQKQNSSKNVTAGADKKKSKKSSKKTKKNKKKGKKDDSYDSESDDSDDSDSDDDSDESSSDSEERRRKERRNKKKNKLGKAPKAERQIAGSTPQATTQPQQPQTQPQPQVVQQPVQQTAPTEDLFGILSGPTTAPAQPTAQPAQSSGFAFMQQPQQQQQPQNTAQNANNMFGGMTMAQPQNQANNAQATTNMFANMTVNTAQPAQPQPPAAQNTAFGFMQQPSQNTAQSSNNAGQSMFSGMNLAQQQPTQPQTTNSASWDPFGSSSQPPAPVAAPTQPQAQAQVSAPFDPFGSNNTVPQAQPQPQQSMPPQTQPILFDTAQSAQQPQSARVKPSDAFGGSLFNFDSMKQDQVKIHEQKQQVQQKAVDPQKNLLQSGQNDTLDSMWISPNPSQNKPAMNLGGAGGFGAPGAVGSGLPSGGGGLGGGGLGMMQGQGQGAGAGFAPMMGAGGFQPQMQVNQPTFGMPPQQPQQMQFNNPSGMMGQQQPNPMMGMNMNMQQPNMMGNQQQKPPSSFGFM